MFTVMTWNVENLFRTDSPDGPTSGASLLLKSIRRPAAVTR